MAFPPWVNSVHVVISVSIRLSTKSKGDAPFHRIAYDYSRADWDGLNDHLVDIPREDIFEPGASVVASEFCEWVQVGLDVSLKVKPHSFPWFLAACAAAIALRNHFFHLYQQNSFSKSNAGFRQASNRFDRDRVLEAAKLAYTNKTKELITSQKLGVCDFWRIVIIILNKGIDTGNRQCSGFPITDVFLTSSI